MMKAQCGNDSRAMRHEQVWFLLVLVLALVIADMRMCDTALQEQVGRGWGKRVHTARWESLRNPIHHIGLL